MTKLCIVFFFSEKENENGEAMDGQCNGPSTANKISPENDASQQPPLTQQGNLFTSSEVKKDLPVKQLDKMSMMDQLTQELGKKQKLYQLKQLVTSCCIVSTIFIVWEFQSTKSWDTKYIPLSF